MQKHEELNTECDLVTESSREPKNIQRFVTRMQPVELAGCVESASSALSNGACMCRTIINKEAAQNQLSVQSQKANENGTKFKISVRFKCVATCKSTLTP